MPIILKPENVLDIGADRAAAADEISDERFDRTAFARRAIDLVQPLRTTVALCEGASRVRVESGRVWGRGDERWAMIAIPAQASRRSIALAVMQLAGGAQPYTIDVLMDEAADQAGRRAPSAA
jgi:hypothetical protein